MKRLICLLLALVILVLLAFCIWLHFKQKEALEYGTNEPEQTPAWTSDQNNVQLVPSEAPLPSSEPVPSPSPIATPASLPAISTEGNSISVYQPSPASQPAPVQTPVPTVAPSEELPQGEGATSGDSGFSGGNELPEIST